VSQADIDKLHGHLKTLDGEAARQVKGGKQITEAAAKKLAATVKRLAEIKPMSEPDEYQQLLEEKGVLEQVLGTPNR
jgi:hypothetical protein